MPQSDQPSIRDTKNQPRFVSRNPKSIGHSPQPTVTTITDTIHENHPAKLRSRKPPPMPWSSAFSATANRPAARPRRPIAPPMDCSRNLMERKEITGKKFELVPLLGPAGHRRRAIAWLSASANATNSMPARPSAPPPRPPNSSPANRAKRRLFSGRHQSRTDRERRGRRDRRLPGARPLSRRKETPSVRGNSLGRQRRRRRSRAARCSARAINLTRRLVNEPPQEIYPESFAARAAEVAKACGLECEIWDQAATGKRALRFAAGRGPRSSRPPRLVILRYQRRAQAGDPLLALVGKGVTFDSGGLSLKPTDGMLTMKCDMAGAATVLGAMQAIAQLKLPVNVIGLMGLVENMTGPAAFKLGDVLTPAAAGRSKSTTPTPKGGWCWPTCCA